MGKTERFFKGPLDKTPYGSCGLLAVIMVGLFCLGFWGLWTAARTLKQNHIFQLPTFSTPSSSSGSDLLQKVQDASKQKSQEAIDAAKRQAEEAAKEEANRQLELQKQQLLDQAGQYTTSPSPK